MKRLIIEVGVKFLEEKGIFNQEHYLVSLQGPTFIFTSVGSTLLTDEIKEGIAERGILILA
jgi:hypothetical protein